MFITKRHIPRRTFLRGAGVTLALPLLDSMVPAATLLAQTAAAPKPRFVAMLHSARRGAWLSRAAGASLPASTSMEGALTEMPFIYKPLEPWMNQTVDSERHSLPVGGAAARPEPGRPLGGVGVPRREQAEADRRRGRLERHDDRSDHRAEDRPGQR